MPTLPPSKRGYQLPLSELFLVAFVGEGTLKKHTTLEPILSPEFGLYTLPDTNIAPENGGGFPPGSLEIPDLETISLFRGELNC